MFYVFKYIQIHIKRNSHETASKKKKKTHEEIFLEKYKLSCKLLIHVI